MNWADVAANVIPTGLAALGGAWAAFLLESSRQKRRQKDNQYAAIRLAHFAVMSQYQELITLRDSYLRDLESQADAWLRLHPMRLGFAAPTVNIPELAFTFESSDPDLLNRLVVGEARYQTVRKIITIRNDEHLALQSRVAALQAKDKDIDGAEDEETFSRMLGKDLIAQLKAMTAELFAANRDAILLLEANLKDITALSAERFPKRGPPRIEVVSKDKRGQASGH